MKNLLNLILLCTGSLFAQPYLVDASYVSTTTATTLSAFSSNVLYDVDLYKVTYNTTDVDGSQVIATGALMIPVNTVCTEYSLVSYSHGTVLKKDDVPSSDNSEAFIAKLFATEGYIAVSADYLGLGDSPGLHPYLHVESQATATIDLLRASREFYRDSLGLDDNNELFLTGYSQGGHAAMGTAKYLQDNNLLTEFNVIGAGPASGPYNLSGTQGDRLLSNQPYSTPGYVCYLLFGMQKAYGNIYSSYSDILKSPYDTTIPPLFDGTYTIATVNAALPTRIADFIEDSVLTNMRNDSITQSHPITRALIANDLYDWAPSFPVAMYYCTQDEQVDYRSSLVARDSMLSKGASAVAINKGARNHGGCVFPAMLDAYEFFDTTATPCRIGLVEREILLAGVYPNPANTSISIEADQDEFPIQLELISLNGQLLKSLEIESPYDKVSISELEHGVYLCKLNSATTKSRVLKLMID